MINFKHFLLGLVIGIVGYIAHVPFLVTLMFCVGVSFLLTATAKQS